jgi:tagatose 6-phosphate kinase
LDRVLLVPDLQPGESQDAIDDITLPGGKGLNVARTAHALGSQVMATGLVAGSCGQWICALLEQMGISERFVRLPHGESRTSIILVDPQQRQTTVVHDRGPTVPNGMWPEIRNHIAESVGGYPWVALCGSCPSGLPDTVYADLCRDLQARGQRTCVDARDQWLVHAQRARPFLVKCNQHEAARVLNAPVETPEQACHGARQWIAAGTRHVVITLGQAGAIAAQEGHAWHITAPQVQALCPVGSGDAMMAGLIVALGRGAPLPDATQYGVAMGAANTLKLGSACCDLDAMPALLVQTKIKAACP